MTFSCYKRKEKGLRIVFQCKRPHLRFLGSKCSFDLSQSGIRHLQFCSSICQYNRNGMNIHTSAGISRQ